jgi:hypothetical protein
MPMVPLAYVKQDGVGKHMVQRDVKLLCKWVDDLSEPF